MEKIIKTKTVNYNTYKTSDGKEFDSEEKAQIHEDMLTGLKKKLSQFVDGLSKKEEKIEEAAEAREEKKEERIEGRQEQPKEEKHEAIPEEKGPVIIETEEETEAAEIQEEKKEETERVAAETLCNTGLVVLAGEITTNANVDYIPVLNFNEFDCFL